MILSNNEAIDRAKICASCPELIKATWTCKKCGCFMKVKTRIAKSSCPLDKWAAVEEKAL